jgi:hypothetical protein
VGTVAHDGPARPTANHLGRGAAGAGGLALLMIGAIVSHILAGDAKGSLPAAVIFAATVAAVVVRILSM